MTGLRKLLLWRATGRKSRLPGEYREVAYIESDGSQYIDTGITPNGNTRTIISFHIIGTNAEYACLAGGGSTVVGSLQRYIAWQLDGRNNRRNRFLFGTYTKTVTFAEETDHTVDFNDSEGNVTVDGEYFDSLPADAFEPTDRKLALFGRGIRASGTDTADLLICARVYACRIIDNAAGELQRDFVPCYRKSDGVGGMYDLAGGAFYASSGSADFILPE